MMSQHASEDDVSPGSGVTGSQMLGGIALVVTSEESLTAPRTEGTSGDESEPCNNERRRVNGCYSGKGYGATTETRVNSGLSVVRHLSVHSAAKRDAHRNVRTRRVTVHTFSDMRELKELNNKLPAPGFDAHRHSCSVIDSSNEKNAFDSNKLFAAHDAIRHTLWRSCDDLRSERKLSSTGSSLSDDVTSRWQLDVMTPGRLTSVTSCCSLGHTASSDSVNWGRKPALDERSTQSDPSNVGKGECTVSVPEPHQVHSDFPTFIFDSTPQASATSPYEDVSLLKRFKMKRGYGSSYRGLVSSGDPPAPGDQDKDSIDTGSISTMQTLQFEFMDETPSWRIAVEIVIPFLLAGFGMVAAGLLLDSIQHWDVFTHISEVFILVPALLGLKGNLEMTLASRLSTQANLGNMDSAAEQWKMIAGNLALTQAQAIVVGFLAAVAAMVLGWIPEGKFDINHAFLLCCSSVLTAAFASFVLGTVMILVVLLSRKCHVNPDNVATPIAASLGDLTTLALLSGISSIMYKAIASNQLWLAPTLLFLFLGLTPIWCVVSHRNKYTHEILYSGWTPVIGAMVISSLGGLILDFAVGNYHGIAVFQPVINGVGGNLVAVQASRLSTALHRVSTPGNLPEGAVSGCPNVFSTFFGSGVNARTARVLMLLVVPGHLTFMYTIHYMNAGHTSITLIFASVYLSAAVLQVFLLLYISNWLVHWLWKRGNDPDNFSIPYLTAIGDLLGTGFLAAAFQFLYVIGDRDADVGD